MTSMTKRADSLQVLADSDVSNNLFDSNVCRCWTSRTSMCLEVSWNARAVTTPGVVDRRGVSGQGPDTTKEYSAVRLRGDKGVSTPGVATHCSAVRRRGNDNASTPGVDATSCVDGCKRPALKLACCRAAGLHEVGHDQAGLDDACPRVQEPARGRPQTGMSAGGIKEHSSMAGPGRNASDSGIHKKK
ncbi:reverse transcriptase [Phytophthora megakarya]|uniref:Reverse transcriptase n=1 Tax=Phytophthora megakarya TaxID=4795 RepID=A0A225VVN0_9STRA|nr:reverse transcriptase [Phytophthora megakarya]